MSIWGHPALALTQLPSGCDTAVSVQRYTWAQKPHRKACSHTFQQFTVSSKVMCPLQCLAGQCVTAVDGDVKSESVPRSGELDKLLACGRPLVGLGTSTPATTLPSKASKQELWCWKFVWMSFCGFLFFYFLIFTFSSPCIIAIYNEFFFSSPLKWPLLRPAGLFSRLQGRQHDWSSWCFFRSGNVVAKNMAVFCNRL